ncbi:MAG: hypothetical protein WC495_02015 [Patescibacteria group bacterium]|jgi:glucan phosphoethanolaminetransferase (alkaline phosphatase superfamily)
MEEKQNPSRTKPAGVIILIAAAALAFIFNIFYSTVFHDSKAIGFFYAIPVLAVVAVLQDFGFRVRDGKVKYFNDLTPQQLAVTTYVILFSSIIVVVIAVLVRSVGDAPKLNFFWYLVFMALSYVITWLIPYARKIYTKIENP